jgi:hypothetical protein
MVFSSCARREASAGSPARPDTRSEGVSGAISGSGRTQATRGGVCSIRSELAARRSRAGDGKAGTGVGSMRAVCEGVDRAKDCEGSPGVWAAVPFFRRPRPPRRPRRRRLPEAAGPSAAWVPAGLAAEAGASALSSSSVSSSISPTAREGMLSATSDVLRGVSDFSGAGLAAPEASAASSDAGTGAPRRVSASATLFFQSERRKCSAALVSQRTASSVLPCFSCSVASSKATIPSRVFSNSSVSFCAASGAFFALRMRACTWRQLAMERHCSSAAMP